MREAIAEMTQQALKLKDKVDVISYDMAKKEISLYFSRFYKFGKGAEDIYHCGSLAQAVFFTLFNSHIRQIALSIFINFTVFAGLALLSQHHWQSGFLFSLVFFIISLFFINGKKESLYKKFMENEKIKVKTAERYMWICKDDIAEQMIKEDKW